MRTGISVDGDGEVYVAIQPGNIMWTSLSEWYGDDYTDLIDLWIKRAKRHAEEDAE